ncbi:MAG: hypothetical protein QOC99_3858 [Acidobacteriota bacterium]|jgi:hypothetical protein|nr:hypothetical protein [Acidobacteriota bacterium]
MSRKRRVKYHVRRRSFLNRDPQLPAFVIGIVEDTRDVPDDDPEQSWKWGAVTLEFGDCYRRVSFDFGMEKPEERADSLYKIRRLAEVVNAVRRAIELEAASLDARPTVEEKKQ